VHLIFVSGHAGYELVQNMGPFHRAHIMEEMHAGSVAELVRMAGQLGIAPQG
jgi:FixJ family two-component response regulator